MISPNPANFHPDQKYIEALITNDATLLEEIYRNYSVKIIRMIKEYNGNEDDARDVIQDALITIYNKAKSGKFILTCPFEAFLYLLCKHKWLNELNKKKIHRVTFNDTEGYPISEDTVKLVEVCNLEQKRKNLLEEKLEQLGDSCKKLLQLSWSGISMHEVADKLCVTYSYVRKRKSECMSKLAKLVQESSQFNALKW